VRSDRRHEERGHDTFKHLRAAKRNRFLASHATANLSSRVKVFFTPAEF